MVLAIAALVFHLHVVSAVIEPVSVIPAAQVTASKPAPATEIAPSDSEPALTERILASNSEQIAANESSSDRSASAPALSPASFSSVVRSSESLSAIRVTTPESKALRFVTPESLPSRRKWLALSTAQHAAATFDAYTTRRAITRGAIESDPLMRPFAHSAGIYAAIQLAPVALDFAGRRMQRSQNNFLRRTWWLPQTAATGMFIMSGINNLNVADKLR